MEKYKVRKLESPINCNINVPGSKSITNRALFLASMADGVSTLRNVLFSDDSRSFLCCLQELGYDITVNEEARMVTVKGGSPCNKAIINVRSAGTSARFFTALLSASPGEYEIQATEQMCRRPMKPLCEALESLGVEICYLGEKWFLPFRIKGGNKRGGEISLNAEQSSQFLSSLLMTGGLYEEGLTIHHIGKEIAKPYIYMTMEMMKQFGGEVCNFGQTYVVKPGNSYRSLDYMIEPDVSGACYFFALAVLTGGRVLVKDVHLSSMQGDIRFLEILKLLGAEVHDTSEGIEVKGPAGGIYNGIDVDLNDCSDQTMTLAALAVFAKTPTKIHNINHIKLQESDRIQAILSELKKMGIVCNEINDGIVIYPGSPIPTIVETYNDHRMAMAFTLVGLKAGGIIIDNPSCVSKTFENYFDIIDTLYE